MYHARSGNVIALRLEAGEEVHQGLLDCAAAYGLQGAYVLSGIGMLKDPLLGWFDTVEKRYHQQDYPGRHELLNLSGNISLRDGAPMTHLHVTLSDEEYRCFGGHLFNAEVGLTLEVALLVVGPEAGMSRTIEADYGLPGLIVKAL
jgi:uncharacterized protein